MLTPARAWPHNHSYSLHIHDHTSQMMLLSEVKIMVRVKRKQARSAASIYSCMTTALHIFVHDHSWLLDVDDYDRGAIRA